MSTEISNTYKAIKAAIRKAKTIYVMNQLTEGYIRVYKNDLLRDLESVSNNMEVDSSLYIRNDGNVLYIN